MDSELLGKIVTCTLTALVTLAVCLINNYYQSRRDEKAREEAHAKQLDIIKTDYSGQISELKTDVYAKFQELQSTVQTVLSDNKHQYDMIKMEIKLLSERQQKYNDLQIRTYELEKRTEVQEEKLKTINDKISEQ